jgi:hypothetical protein
VLSHRNGMTLPLLGRLAFAHARLARYSSSLSVVTVVPHETIRWDIPVWKTGKITQSKAKSDTADE